MAYGKRWNVPFVSRNNIVYSVNIYQRNYNGTVTTLTGGAEPFVTSEDTSDDILTPIRTQSGYINIVCDRNTWRTIIDNGDYVNLTDRNGKIYWNGFISKESFNGSLFEPLIEYQIPVHCILTHMKSYYFKLSPFDSPTFAQILCEAFNMIGRVPYYMYWTDAHGEIPYFLEERFQRSNFYNEDQDKNTDLETVISGSITYFDVISEICKYFGIVLCTFDNSILFNSPSSTQYAYYSTTQDLYDIERYGSNYSVHSQIAAQTGYKTLADVDFMSANSQESVLQPVKNVKIVGEINVYDDFDGTYPKNTIDEWVDKHFTQIIYQDSEQNRTYIREFDKIYHTGPSYEERGEFDYPSQYQQYESNTVVLKLYKYSGAPAPDHFGDINSLDVTKMEDVLNKIDYNFRNLIYVHVMPLPGRNPVFGLYGKHDVSLGSYSGAINLDYSVMENPGNSRLQWVLKIGDYYWSGVEWVDYFHAFSTEFEELSCKSNRRLGDGYDGTRGFIIPINRNLSGEISLELIATGEGTTRLTNYFTDISLKYVRRYNTRQSIDFPNTIESNSLTGVSCIDSYEQDCKFATSPYINGYGAVLKHNKVPLSNYPFDSGIQSPEDYRNDVVWSWRNRPLSIFDIEVNDNFILSNRYEYISSTSGWPGFVALSVSRKWRDSMLSLKLIQL